MSDKYIKELKVPMPNRDSNPESSKTGYCNVKMAELDGGRGKISGLAEAGATYYTTIQHIYAAQ